MKNNFCFSFISLKAIIKLQSYFARKNYNNTLFAKKLAKISEKKPTEWKKKKKYKNIKIKLK